MSALVHHVVSLLGATCLSVGTVKLIRNHLKWRRHQDARNDAVRLRYRHD